MEFKKTITEIIYKNSHDTSEGVLIDFKNIHSVIDKLDEAFALYAVSQQRELLIDCVDHCYEVDNYKFRTTEDKVDNYLESINCG